VRGSITRGQKLECHAGIPLWPETVAAVRLAIEKRRPAKSEADAKLLLIGARGTSYVKHTGGLRVAAEFARLRDDVGIKDRVFYDLRRTFQTVADNQSRDRDGVKAIMGHAPASGDMSAIYRQGFDDDRLRAIVNAVRGWLFPKPTAAKKPKLKAPKAATTEQRPQREPADLRVVG
jgi:integrase